MTKPQKIALIGGTGPEGKGLAVRFSLAGHEILVGSRDAARAQTLATEFTEIVAVHPGTAPISGAINREAADAAGIVFLAVPFAAQEPTLIDLADAIAGKIVVNVIAPLEFRSGRAIAAPPPAGSAAEAAAAQSPRARWVAGFHTLPASELADPTANLDTDVLICGGDDDAKREIMTLANEITGARAVDAGLLESARYLEGATALLININRIYKAHGSIRVMGI